MGPAWEHPGSVLPKKPVASTPNVQVSSRVTTSRRMAPHGLTIRNMQRTPNNPSFNARPLKALAAFALGALALAGLPATAQEIAAPVSVPATASAGSEMEGLMAYVLKARQMSADDLAAELREQRRLHEAGNDVATLKLALVMADQPNVQEQDITALLQPLFEESRGTKPELRAFALLVARDMQDRKRMKETLASTQNRLRDAQRSQEASEAKAAQMRRQIDDLQNKINAFMMMEQSILKRGR
ncbi:MAG: hypothetical protein SF172_18305 [Burkholderiales bacterium]|nr:hypothetical protein [Burkholderiales bacterium]